MTKQEMVTKLVSDLGNEYTHMLFYVHAASTILGPHRLEYQEFLEEQAASEMKHVRQFSDLILSLGGVPEVSYKTFPTLTVVKDILNYAIKLESEVLGNYLTRMEEADILGGEDGMAIRLFLEEQFLHSREDRDRMKLFVLSE